MTPVSPLGYTESLEDERLMMEILRGSPALSAFRINKLLARFQAARLPVHNITPSMSILLTSMRR
ncbi:Phosphoribosylformylglycinamidine synthase [Escherichia coli]|uniref:Phosphoribosylformylglycinamidine synthase n=1 Tax=Escherichia coli TaxID=562 RepID=A0A376KST5_ECOLX|nr:Phosphoribosylformylglycinamidine synthase [Escherichia coli]